MDILSENIKKIYGDKYDYLKLYDIIYDEGNGQCIVTFLYPMTMREVDDLARKEIEEFVSKFLALNAEVKVKFKKSFNDFRILRKEIKRFVDENFKAISIYLKDEQVFIEQQEEKILVSVHIGQSLEEYYLSNKVSSKIFQFLNENNIGDFVVDYAIDSSYEIEEEIGEVEVVVEAKRKVRYQVEYIKKIVGSNIAPEPELIKHQDKPKQGVILAGFVSNLNSKEYVAKSGKSKGQTKKLYTFTLDDGKKIDCVFFCSKTNEKAIESLENEMFVLCLGNLENGLTGKLTYYPRSIAYAAQKEKLEDVIEEEEQSTIDSHKQVVFAQKYNYTKQEDLFTKEIHYTDFIMNNEFVIYDLETTGFDAVGDEIIEIGAVKIVNGEVTEYFSTFVEPTKPIPPESTKVHNITDDMVKGAPKIADAIIDFYRFCKGAVVGGYNSDEFDNKFIKQASKKVGFNFDNTFIDVIKLARQAPIAPRNYKLISVCQHLGIELVDAHRAYNDAFATARVLLKLNEID